MEASQESAWTDRSNDCIPHHSLHILGGSQGGRRQASLLLRKMGTQAGRGIVVRELWPAGDRVPQEFSSDRELARAMQQLGLPVFDGLERVRRSVAATQLPG